MPSFKSTINLACNDEALTFPVAQEDIAELQLFQRKNNENDQRNVKKKYRDCLPFKEKICQIINNLIFLIPSHLVLQHVIQGMFYKIKGC